MKRLLTLAAVLALNPAASALDTAYTALRAYGKKDGEKALYSVVELRGSDGSPQPAIWTLIVDAPDARGGIREVEVKGGRIIGQRTPVARDTGPVMNFNQLNLDSDGAFTVANQEAGKRRVAFDRADYVLRGGSRGGVPVWVVTLFEKGGQVGTLRIAADSGEIQKQDFSPPRRAAEDRTYVDGGRTSPPPPPPPQDRRPPPPYGDEPYYEDRGDPDARGPAEGTLPAFIDRVGRHFQKRGRQLENFFTGK